MDTLLYFKALSDATRIRLVNTLIHHELSVNEIVALMNMGQSGISRHLKILTDAEILKCRRDGVWAFYSVSDRPGTRKLIESIQYLFHEDPFLEKDLEKASRLIEDRSIRTMHFFNTIATDWDLLKKEILGRFDLNRAIAEKMEPCTTAVDLGCGTGELLLHIRQKAKKVIGVDSSAQMLEQTRKRFPKDNGVPDLRLGELEHLPLRDGEAELAIISMVLHHMSAPALAIAETCRILKPGGTLIIADLNKHNNETMRQSYGDRWLGFHPDEIQNFLNTAGFQLQSRESHPIGQQLEINIFTSIKTH
ncbi:MAG: methyltransferase domain-containing protein [Desulfobacteraceae bacterium]|nr:MAG: methyltransferase domain-containing protein [Desulfobacteraceae bacterium]